MSEAGLAEFWRRFVAYLVDAIILGVVGAVINGIIGAVAGVSGADATSTGVRSGLVGLILGLIYFGYLWTRTGQSIGYLAMGIRVVRADGAPITFGLAAARYALVYLSFVLCFVPAIISAFMIGLSPRKQAIHDAMVGTVVVRA